MGTKGRATVGRIEGSNPFTYKGPNPNPYEQEHADLIPSIREGKPLNEGRAVAEATLTAIIGRISAYTGQPIRYAWALTDSELDLTPSEIKRDGYRLGPAPKVPPPSLGNEEVV